MAGVAAAQLLRHWSTRSQTLRNTGRDRPTLKFRHSIRAHTHFVGNARVCLTDSGACSVFQVGLCEIVSPNSFSSLGIGKIGSFLKIITFFRILKSKIVGASN
jgi:hypothetical protein